MFRSRVFVMMAMVIALPGYYSIPAEPGAQSSQDFPPTQTMMMGMRGSGGSRNFEPVIFSAVHATDKSRRSVSRVLFDVTLTDVGFGWSSNRSEFVCFYAGTYFFTFTGLSDSTSNFKIALMKNNDEIAYAWGERVGYQSGSNSVILTLQKNDRVYLNIQEGMLHETKKGGRGYTSFSGFRLN